MNSKAMPSNHGKTLCQPSQTILFVDDEIDILNAIKRELRSEPYQQHFVCSAKEALDLLPRIPINVLVSDMRMPHMDGVALLERVARRYPDIVRMVISGLSDTDTVLDAVNNGHIYRYLVKPWDSRELKVTLRQALEMHRLQVERREMLSQLCARNKRLEEKVVQRTQQILAVSQQADIGKYASQIVSKLDEPINTISTAVELIGLMAGEDHLDPGQLKKEVVAAQTGIDRLKQIVAGIADRVQEERSAQISLINLNQLIKEELDYFELDPFFRFEVRKEVRLTSDIPQIMGNPAQLKQILYQLIKNAIEAMTDAANKKLIIETVLQGSMIVVNISDTGCGISPEHLDRIFSDEFTTKPIGKGTGLGLASVKSIMAAYSGSIDVTSSLQAGTTFRICFPIGRPKIN